jgi:hypothetical protein
MPTTRMSDKPHQFRPPLDSTKDVTDAHAAAPEQRGWDAYRKWLSRVATKPPAERTPLDHSIYSWRGYQTWADKVRQTWKSES